MKTLYLECAMGAAGDMLAAALMELLPDPDGMIQKLNALGIPGVQWEREPSEKCGILGTHLRVRVNGQEEHSHDEHDHEHHHDHDHDHEHHHDHDHDHEHHHDHDHDHEHHHDHDHEHHHDHDHDHEHHHDHDHDHEHHHHHASLGDIEALIRGLDVSERVKENALSVYMLIAQAEGKAHGKPVSEIHFHEVGTLDAVADVVGVCLLMEEIGADQVLASPVHVGAGQVRCAHGILPVPAPATAEILKGVPTYGGKVMGELCTPTGAALLRHFVSSFGDRPLMAVSQIGYGMGSKDFERANCVRAFLGESQGRTEEITRLECNLDDMTGEEISFACERLFSAGARDVYTQAIGMKKGRPGVLLSCVCMPEGADQMAALIMKHTSTLGVRRLDMARYVLEREISEKQTPLGLLRVKTAKGMGVCKEKIEYDDLARAARERGLSLSEARRAADQGCED